MMDCCGLDCLGVTEIGMEGTDIAKMFGNLLSGTGGIMSGGTKKGGGGDDGAAAAERRRLEDEKRRAEESAATMKKVAIGIGLAAMVGGVYLVKRKAA